MSDDAADDDAHVMLVVEEEPVVGVAVRETARVVVEKTVETRNVRLEAPEAHEEVIVERRAIGVDVDGPLPIRTEGDVTIVPVVEEVAVVVRRYVLREEVRITRRRVETPRIIEVVVRRDHVTTRRVESPPPSPGPSDEPRQPEPPTRRNA